MTAINEATVFQHIRWEMAGGTGTLVLNRPPSNDMTVGLFDEVNTLVEMIRHDTSVKGIIIRGAGRHFSSGAALDKLLDKIKEAPCTEEQRSGSEHFLTRNYRAMLFFEEVQVPVIAAIRGVCLGSAFELALLCHFRLCSDDAVFGLPETGFNLFPGLGGIRKIAELSGKANAIELVLRGKTFGAEEALDLGLVDRIVPKKELAAKALDLVHSLAGNYRSEKRPLYLKRYFDHDVVI